MWWCPLIYLSEYPKISFYFCLIFRKSGPKRIWPDMGSIPDPGRSHMPWTNQVRVPQLLRLCSRAWEPQLLKPAWPRAHALQQEKSPAMRSCALQPALPHSPQLEKSRHSNEDPAQPKISKWNYKKEKKWLNVPLNKIIPQLYPKLSSFSLVLLSYQYVHH